MSKNFSNFSILKSILLANIRSYTTDALNMYLIVPMSVLGTILNIITIIVLIRKSFRNKNIFKLMIIYSLTSFIITFFMIFAFLFAPHILFDLSVSEIGRIYSCNVTNMIILLFFFYGNCLDILMNLERALNYSNKYEKMKNIPAYTICFIVFIICVIIHLPSDLAQSYTPNDQLYIRLRLCYATSFATTTSTKIILYICYIIEGPIIMILVIGSNIVAFSSYKSFIKRKEELTISSNDLTDFEKRKEIKKEKLNRKLFLMTIYLSIFSIISHLIQFGSQLVIFAFAKYFTSPMYSLVVFIYTFIIIFKHFFTIVFFNFFNSKFKNNLKSFCFKLNQN